MILIYFICPLGHEKKIPNTRTHASVNCSEAGDMYRCSFSPIN